MVLRIIYRVHNLSSILSHVKFYRTSAPLFKTVQFNLSDIGEGIREVTLREWSVKVGDVVAQFDNICLVESDKATVTITSRYDGKITKLYYEVGDTAFVGKPLVDIDVKDKVSEGQQISTPVEQTPSPEAKVVSGMEADKKTSAEERHLDEVDQDSHFINKALATPAVRRIAKENSILISKVPATGKGGRVLKEDVLKYLEEMSRSTADQFKKPEGKGDTKQVERVKKIDGIMKVMVKTMTKSHSIPSFGYCDEINVSKLFEVINSVKEQAKRKGIHYTFMPFFIKALSNALKEYPIFNSSVDENCENIIFKQPHNIGIAMDTKKGLLVPNIKNVENLKISEIAVELKRLLEAGRDLKLGPSDMTGGTITISNFGVIGGTYARPLILPPEVCIVAVGRACLTPIVNDKGEIVKAHITKASWTADHRVIDGATMARFSNVWKGYIENPNYLLLDL